MIRTCCFLTFALSSSLLASTAAAQQPAPAVAQQPAPAVAQQPPPAALPPGYYPPPPAYAPPYGQQAYGVPPLRANPRFSTPMMVSGLVMSSMGALLLAAGTFAWVVRDGIVCNTGTCGRHGGDTVMMVVGGVSTLAGIPLIVIGARRGPAKPEESALAPTISVSPRGASLSFTF
jgi:hypothetical protein